ncbi:hypothetical protein SAMN02910356_02485 [Selenomonas sp. GACV-9]|uniref:hypothetical protein n=1 Tax=Selenomonas sp. GACV-9 TaxID=3158782 RepID=UPI0008F3ED75|nr:hypothetical protein SAMN02910356_02485 [Selenomonas ruminantium]
MFNKKSLKVTTAAVLASFVSLGIFSATVSEASPRHHQEFGPRYEVQELAHRHHNSHPKKYSEGERNTAAIIGAVVGAVIAKNT